MSKTTAFRPCRVCSRLYEDPGPGRRTAPAGLCSKDCHQHGTPIKAAKRRAVSPASPSQRLSVKDRACVVTGEHGVDPAHLWPRSLGGCDDPLCVVPLSRAAHASYDRHELDLLPYLVAHGFHAEIAHMVLHARGDVVAVLEMLTGEKWRPVEAKVAT